MMDSRLMKLFLLDSQLMLRAGRALDQLVGLSAVQLSSGSGLRSSLECTMIRPSSTLYSYKNVQFRMIANRADKADIEMGETLVTQALFKAVMGFNYSAFQSYYDSPQRPVEGVSWFDCISFCNLLSVGLGLEPYYGIRHTRRGYKQSIEYAFVEELGNDGFRLPHVNEWRMFAKAGSENEWPGTNDPAKMNRYGWFGHYEGDDSQSRRVAQLLPNEWGLYDMAGNAWEWCGHPRMTFDDNPLNNREVIGGSYASSLSELKIAFNASRDPAERDSDASFRLCRSGSMKGQKS